MQRIRLAKHRNPLVTQTPVMAGFMRPDPGTPLVEATVTFSPVPETPIINKFNRLNPPSKHGFLGFM